MTRWGGVSLGAASGLLAAGLAAQERWLLAALAIGLGVGWLAGSWRQWSAANTVGLAGHITLAVAAAMIGVSGSLLLVAVVLALAGWDLHRFSQRVGQAARIEQPARLWQTHLRWLAGGGAAGLGAGFIAQKWQISLGLGWIVLLGLLAAISLNWLVLALRQRGR